MTADLAKLEELLAAAIKRTSKRWSLTKRKDGTAQIYSPNLGPLRIIVPIAETTVEDGEVLVTLYNESDSLLSASRALSELRAALPGLRIATHRQHCGVYGIEDKCTCGADDHSARIDELMRESAP